MRIFLLSSLGGEETANYESRGLTIGRLLSMEHLSQTAVIQLEPGGRIGEHEAATNQLFVVVEGIGWAAGPDGSRQPLKPGFAAFWQAGELHEVGSKDGLTALVIESDGLTLESLP